MRRARITAPVVLASLLGACAAPTPPPASVARAPEAVPAAAPSLTMVTARRGTDAVLFLEELAARCWLDEVVGGNALFVDRRSGRMTIAGEDTNLVVAEPTEPISMLDSMTTWRVTGQAVEDDALAQRLSATFLTAESTGETACPGG